MNFKWKVVFSNYFNRHLFDAVGPMEIKFLGEILLKDFEEGVFDTIDSWIEFSLKTLEANIYDSPIDWNLF